MNEKKINNINVKKLTLSINSSVRDAIEKINEGGFQIVLVVNNFNVLLGTITDGDIRRGLLKGVKLEDSIEHILHTDYYFINEGKSKNQAFELMKKTNLRHLPVLNKKKELKNLIFLEDFIKTRKISNIMIIMAGGKGRRLLPFTLNKPKPMIKIGDKPILEIILQRCINSGFENFYFSVNYLKSQIIDYFEDGSKWNVNINYLSELKPMGTAGSLNLLLNKPTESFLVTNGDVLTTIDYSELLNFHKENQSDITICIREFSSQIPYGVVKIENHHVTSLDEKPYISKFINAGIYVLEPKILKLLNKGDIYIDMNDLIELAIKKGYNVGAFPIHERWLDIGLSENLKSLIKNKY